MDFLSDLSEDTVWKKWNGVHVEKVIICSEERHASGAIGRTEPSVLDAGNSKVTVCKCVRVGRLKITHSNLSGEIRRLINLLNYIS